MTERLLILLLIACVITTVFSGCVQSSDSDESDVTESESAVVEVSDFKIEEYKPQECDPEKDWKLVIRGEDIGYIKYNEGYRDNKEDKYLEIPLVVVLEKLKVPMEWQSDNEVDIILKNSKYTLDTAGGTITDKHSKSLDLFRILPPGSNRHLSLTYKNTGENFIVDDFHIISVMSTIKEQMRYDSEERSLSIGCNIDDFNSITVGKSTYDDVEKISDCFILNETEYGGFIEYPVYAPMIRIEFTGEDLVVSKIEKIG